MARTSPHPRHNRTEPCHALVDGDARADQRRALYFKATSRGSVFEAASTERLAGWYPDCMPELITDSECLSVSHEGGLISSEVRQLRGLASRFDVICRELAAFGIPETRNNGDFHDGNVLVRDGRVNFFDRGDATVTHPFVFARKWLVSMEMELVFGRAGGARRVPPFAAGRGDRQGAPPACRDIGQTDMGRPRN